MNLFICAELKDGISLEELITIEQKIVTFTNELSSLSKDDSLRYELSTPILRRTVSPAIDPNQKEIICTTK